MTFGIYEASIPMFKQMLQNLDGLISKAEAHAASNGLAVQELMDARLYPDMFDFKRQVQIATDYAKGAASRLSGSDLPSYPDTEITPAELHARIAKTLAFLDSFKAEQFAGAENRGIELVFPWATYNFTGSRYLSTWAIPNFFFHVTTAYDILRSKGVAIGKADFLGGK